MKKLILKIYFYIISIFAKIYLKRHSPVVIWITWSIWKTSARMIISEIISQNIKNQTIYTSNKNYNWELWLSLSILKISDYTPSLKWILKTLIKAIKISFFWKKEYDILFLEYWIDHIWEMDFLLSIVKPDISIITKIDKVHSSQFKSKEKIASEKYKLSKNTKKIAFLNYDCEFSKKYYPEIKSKKYLYTSNVDDTCEDIDINISDYKLIKKDKSYFSTFKLDIKNSKQYTIKTNILWAENLWYIWLWVFITNYIKKIDIWNELEFNLSLQPSRFSIFEWIFESILVDSTYNASPLSMKKSIENVYNLRKNFFPDYKIIFCIWDMRELWDYEEKEHKNLKNILKNDFEALFLVWKAMNTHLKPLYNNSKVYWFTNSKKLWKELKSFLEKNIQNKYLILFKWSQNTIFLEEAIKEVLKDKSLENKLCRQDDFWIEKKQSYGIF